MGDGDLSCTDDARSDDQLGQLWLMRSEIAAFIRSREADRTTAEEVLAETYVVAWRRLQRGELPADPPSRRPWLFGVAVRTLMNQRRGARRRRHLAQHVAVHLSRADAPPTSDRLEIAEAWAALAPGDREVLALAGAHGSSATELARALGCSSGAAMTRLSRARTRLDAALGG